MKGPFNCEAESKFNYLDHKGRKVGDANEANDKVCRSL